MVDDSLKIVLEKRLFTISQFQESIEVGIGCLAEVINAVAS